MHANGWLFKNKKKTKNRFTYTFRMCRQTSNYSTPRSLIIGQLRQQKKENQKSKIILYDTQSLDTG